MHSNELKNSREKQNMAQKRSDTKRRLVISENRRKRRRLLVLTPDEIYMEPNLPLFNDPALQGFLADLF